jgi:hypothetical protein
MSSRLKSGFEGEVFDQKRSRSAELVDYLLIYTNYLTPEYRTDSNELIEFLENPNDGQTIVYFGLSYYGKPCGFATLMLYQDTGIGIVDHIAIAPTVRGLGAFFMFCDLIAEFLEKQRHTYNYIAAEIMLGNRPYVSGMPPLTLLRLTRFVGFRLVNMPYIAPDDLNIMSKQPERAALMLLCQPNRTEIDAHELIRILKVIYYDHYLAWCKRTMKPKELAKYREKLSSTLQHIIDFIEREATVKINGMKNLDLPYIVDPHKRPPPLSALHFMVLIAFPAVITIAVALAQETELTLVILGVVCVLYALLFVPRVRHMLFKFFRLE